MSISTVHDLPSNWKQTMVSMYKVGASDTEVRAELSMTYKLWKRLLMTDPSFEDVVNFGKTLAKAWWMTQGRVNLQNREFNANLYKINMQNRFNWNDKVASADESDDEDFQNEEDIDAQLRAFGHGTATAN